MKTYGAVAADERDRLDVGIIADEIDGVVLAVNDIDATIGYSGLFGELKKRNVTTGISSSVNKTKIPQQSTCMRRDLVPMA